MDQAETLFDRFRKQGIEEIRDLIRRKQEENIFIEFKRKSHPNRGSLSDDDKKNYAIALSGFANSEGGLLIWGVKADKPDEESPAVATQLIPITKLQAYLSNLNSLTGQAVVPIVDGVENFHIQNPDHPDTGYIVTYVPKTNLTGCAHRAQVQGTKQYYKRSGDGFYVMEHYDLMDVINRIKHPRVIARVELRRLSTGPDLKLQIILKNIGRIPAIDIYMECYIPTVLQEGITEFPRIWNKKVEGKDYRVYPYYHRDTSGPLPLFPDVEYPILDGNNLYINLKLPASQFEDLQNEQIFWIVYADRSEPQRGQLALSEVLSS